MMPHAADLPARLRPLRLDVPGSTPNCNPGLPGRRRSSLTCKINDSAPVPHTRPHHCRPLWRDRGAGDARSICADAAEPQVAASQLADYVRQAVETLDAQPLEDLARGVVAFRSLRWRGRKPWSVCGDGCGAPLECGGPAR